MIRRLLNPLADAKDRLADALRPKYTLWRYVCMDCGQELREPQPLPYERQHGRTTTSHGICPRCDAVRAACSYERRPVMISIDEFKTVRS